MRSVRVGLLLAWAMFALACNGERRQAARAADDDDDVSPTVTAAFDLRDGAGFFDAPFPIEHMRRSDGTVRFDALPNATWNSFAEFYTAQAARVAHGFSPIGAIFFVFDGALDASALPQEPWDVLAADSPVFLVNINPASGRRGARLPLLASFSREADDYHPANMLTILPYQGAAMSPGELHAAVVMRNLGDAAGRPLGVNPALQQALAGDLPEGANGAADKPAFGALASWLREAGIAPAQLAAATAFRAGDPTPEMRRLRDAVRALPAPTPTDIAVIAEYPAYYVLAGHFDMPIWQNGERPYALDGGEIVFGGDGAPVLQWWENVRFSISVPKQKMPAGGFPLLFFANGIGGNYTQIFDRGPNGGFDEYGEGPGKVFAHRGIACLDIEAPLAGPRSPSGSYEQFFFFNPFNLTAYRDNTRQAASEYTYLLKVASALAIDPALTPATEAGGAPAVVYDAAHFFFWGHSTGASIGNLVLAVEPDFAGGMLSGSGVSWIYNLVYKQEPFPLGEIVAFLLGIPDFTEFTPIPTLFQTSEEPIEPADFAPHVVREPFDNDAPRNILLIGGYLDGYFSPRTIEGLAVALGVDLAGEVVYAPTLAALQHLANAGQIALPASNNRTVNGRAVTAALLQFRAPAGVDGHYVSFQMNAPRYQYGCFFDSLARNGKAVIPPPQDDPFAACE